MNDVVTRMRDIVEDEKRRNLPDAEIIEVLTDAISLIGEMSQVLSPFARKAKALDWRKGSTYRDITTGEEYPDDKAKVMLDTIEVAKATPKQLCIGDFRRARDVYNKANGIKP